MGGRALEEFSGASGGALMRVITGSGEHALNRNPLCSACNHMMFQMNYLAGNYQRAEGYAQRIIQRPEYRDVPWSSYMSMLIVLGRNEEVIDALDVSTAYVERVTTEQMAEAERREVRFRGGARGTLEA